MLSIKLTKLLLFQFTRSILFFFCCRVISAFTFSTRQCNNFSSHIVHQNFIKISRGLKQVLGIKENSNKNCKIYSTISVTRPDATVLQPSRIAKRKVFSIAIGAISSTFTAALSPGMIISVPSGRVMIPVTSVVLK